MINIIFSYGNGVYVVITPGSTFSAEYFVLGEVLDVVQDNSNGEVSYILSDRVVEPSILEKRQSESEEFDNLVTAVNNRGSDAFKRAVGDLQQAFSVL